MMKNEYKCDTYVIRTFSKEMAIKSANISTLSLHTFTSDKKGKTTKIENGSIIVKI